MSTMSENLREAMRKKARRLASGGQEPVDASGYEVPGLLNAGVQTGMRPISRNRFKHGGHVEGERAEARADRKPRRAAGGLVNRLVNADVKKANEEREGARSTEANAMRRGGRARRDAGGPSMASNVPVNRMAFTPASSEMARAAGLKRGGRTSHLDEREDEALIRREVKASALKKAGGGSADDGHWIEHADLKKGALRRELHVPEGKDIPAKKLAKATHSPNKLVARRANLAETLKSLPHKAHGGSLDGELQGTRPTGGREAHAEGGAAGKKGKAVTVNIVIGAGHHDQPKPPMPGLGGPPMPPPMPPGGPPGAPPVVGPPPAAMGPPMGGGAPPMAGMPPPMPRLRGGRTMGMNVGSGSGLGRLQKAQDMSRR